MFYTLEKLMEESKDIVIQTPYDRRPKSMYAVMEEIMEHMMRKLS